MRHQAKVATINTGQPIITLFAGGLLSRFRTFLILIFSGFFSAWTVSQQVSLHSLYHEGLLGQRLGTVNCLRFHPHLLLLATGGTDKVARDDWLAVK